MLPSLLQSFPAGIRVDAIFLELAVKRGSANAETVRALAHLTTVMVDGKPDHLKFDIGQRAHIAALVECRKQPEMLLPSRRRLRDFPIVLCR